MNLEGAWVVLVEGTGLAVAFAVDIAERQPPLRSIMADLIYRALVNAPSWLACAI